MSSVVPKNTHTHMMPPLILRSTITSIAATDDEPSPAKKQKPYPVRQNGTGKRELVPVTNPATGAVIAEVEMCTNDDVSAAVAAAQAALPGWSGLTSKRRAAIMLKFLMLVEENREELVELIIAENGKNRVEAEGDLAKGLETVEWAAALPHTDQGRTLTVSSGVVCSEMREPVGVVASIVPFNFPFMVPMWTAPIALVAGNCVLLKPSEKVPMTMGRAAQLMHEAGVPPAAFQLLHGGHAARRASNSRRARAGALISAELCCSRLVRVVGAASTRCRRCATTRRSAVCHVAARDRAKKFHQV